MTSIIANEKISCFCWGLLYQMLGKNEEAGRFLSDICNRKSSVRPQRARLQQHNKLDTAVNNLASKLLKLVQSDWTIEDNSGIIGYKKSFVEILEDILNTANEDYGPCLTLECTRSNKERIANDSINKGYSRSIFKEIKDIHRPAIALAAISYLFRACSYFRAHPKDRRNSNAAKVALNDLFQSSQLGCRLYYSLNESHVNTGDQNDYLAKVLGYRLKSDEPWKSPFFIWSLLELIEIQRGNIYWQIGNLEEADRYYRHAHDRLSLLQGNLINVLTPKNISQQNRDFVIEFVTPTLVQAMYERSKILFDRGLFVDSIMNQLLSLACLIRFAEQTQGAPGIQGLLTDIGSSLRFLEVTRRESVWDRQEIASRFGLFDKSLPAGAEPIQPRRFAEIVGKLHKSYQILANEIFARLGFTLFMLRRHRSPIFVWSADDRQEETKLQNEMVKRLDEFFTFHTKLDGVKASALAAYCRSIIGTHGKQGNEVIFKNAIDRQLAHRLRECLKSKRYDGNELGENEFYPAVLEVLTQNIGNVVTLPHHLQSMLMRPGYKSRRTDGDLSKRRVYESLVSATKLSPSPINDDRKEEDVLGVRNKLVVLRRWQSFSPKIPRPSGEDVRGGGYLLLWNGKGIAIDPGYDFIQNLYDEGFSLDDIDAVIVSHSHPDHDDDLSVLMTLLREWNEYHQNMGRYTKKKNPMRHEYSKRLDIFLNESTHLKFSAWLKASRTGVGRIVPLPLVTWNQDSEDPNEKIRGKNVVIYLRQEYSLDIETVPAWHDDVIGKTAAVGLKFLLYPSKDSTEPVGVVGYTGDTGAYGWPEPQNEKDGNQTGQRVSKIEEFYKECDVLIAHLGDIRLRELVSKVKTDKDKNICWMLLQDWFCENEKAVKSSVTRDRVREFFDLLVTLNMADSSALHCKLEPVKENNPDDYLTVNQAIGDFIDGVPLEITRKPGNFIKPFYKELNTGSGFPRRDISSLIEECGIETEDSPLEDWNAVFLLLGFLCLSSYKPWHYQYHLGISGVFRLHNAMLKYSNPLPKGQRIFVVGELPEELSSYRHHVARLLNMIKENQILEREKRVYSFTGDIGLHISLTCDSKFVPKIRCHYCNYNNEMVLKQENYHHPDRILETSLKRLGSAMIYLCIDCDHYPEIPTSPREFLYRPNLRVI